MPDINRDRQQMRRSLTEVLIVIVYCIAFLGMLALFEGQLSGWTF